MGVPSRVATSVPDPSRIKSQRQNPIRATVSNSLFSHTHNGLIKVCIMKCQILHSFCSHHFNKRHWAPAVAFGEVEEGKQKQR
ncbi:hypothetical protein NPIL_152741 [Nephila pilipes]|uniref:Uncharacterized protein n=1 Tax=Nephila pilipes TaxID=299642 RepID=A0A8X6MPP7_NEPPI|nr:hypothetical protein NPIL_152741 [Nephila pilipes]